MKPSLQIKLVVLTVLTSIHLMTGNHTKPKKKQTDTVLATPIHSVADKNLYKTIRLRNGLTALLISDTTKTHHAASCAISVGVGYFNDPLDFQGMSHMLEHLFFLASEKYPKENEFLVLLKNSGAFFNAHTEDETTTYFFELPLRLLPKAMDILSHMFISPLISKEAILREVETMESEMTSKMHRDMIQKNQLLKSLFPEGHPAKIFGNGNRWSLRHELKDDEQLYCEVHKFRRRYYSAHRMTAVLQADMDLSTLEEYVEQIFGQFPSNGFPPEDFSSCDYSVDTITPEFRSLFYLKPIGDIREVYLTWILPPLLSEYQSKPNHYIGFLLGHKGKGSILSYLRKKIWALDIDVFYGYGTSINNLFIMRIGLTKNGLEHLDEVVEAVFSYLNKLKYCGPIERIFNELKTVKDTSFRYENLARPADYVAELAKKMHFYPPEHYITGNQLYYKYDPKGIMDLLDSLRADMVNIVVLSRNHTKPIQYDAQEEWIGGEYKREEIPQEWLQRWMNVAPYSDFQIPEKNVYIPTNFDIIPPANPYVEAAKKLGLDLETSDYKEIFNKASTHQAANVTFTKDDLNVTIDNFRLIGLNLFRTNYHMELWYQQDFKRFPTALLYFCFYIPLSLITPREMCLLDLWTDVLLEQLKEEIHTAQTAGFSYDMFTDDTGLHLKIGGYSENLHLLVDLTTSSMRGSLEDVTPQFFEAIRDRRARAYYNHLMDPGTLAREVLLSILLEPHISAYDRSAWVYNITLEEVQNFGPRFFNLTFLQMRIEGNIPWYQAINISEKVCHDLKLKAMAREEGGFPEFKVHELPLGERRVRVKSLNKFSPHSMVVNYYQGNKGVYVDKQALKAIVSLISGPLYDGLRAKERLGYIVSTKFRDDFGVIGFTVTVDTQVDMFSVQHVDKRVDEFLRYVLRYLPDIESKPAATNKSIAQLNPLQYLGVQFQMDSMKNTDLSNIKDWMVKYFPPGDKDFFRKLSVQIEGHNVDEISEEEPEPAQMTSCKLTYLVGEDNEEASEFITDIDEFRKNLSIVYETTFFQPSRVVPARGSGP